jgi:hypothetical protein
MSFLQSVYRKVAKSSSSKTAPPSSHDIDSPLLDGIKPVWIETWSSPDTLDANWIVVEGGGGFGNQELQS